MKRISMIVVFLLLITAPAWAEGNNIRVLILEGAFSVMPAKGEKLSRMEKVDGDLLIEGTKYMGKTTVYKGVNGLYLVNEVPLEKYVESVVKSEAGTDWDLDALKAQAVIVRTYALNRKQAEGNEFYDITSSVLHQVFKGENNDPIVALAVRETEGEILTYEGQPIAAFYHSTSDGMTESSEDVFGKSYPYMQPVSSISKLSPLRAWVRRIPIGEVESVTGVKGITEINTVSLTSTGRVKELELCNDKGEKVVEAKDLRKLFGWKRLPSTDFTIRIEDGVCVFEGKGWGHGVGLCQWCAQEMAVEGKDYKAILKYYYPGAELTHYAG